MRVYRNGLLLSTTTFSIRLDRQQDRTVALLRQGTGQYAEEIRLRADTLELVPQCYDCATARYQRAPAPDTSLPLRLTSREPL